MSQLVSGHEQRAWLHLCLSNLGLDETPCPPGLFVLPSPSGQYRLLEQSYLFKNAPCQYLCSLQLAECSRAVWGVMDGQGELSSWEGLCAGEGGSSLGGALVILLRLGEAVSSLCCSHFPPPFLKFFFTSLSPLWRAQIFLWGRERTITCLP